MNSFQFIIYTILILIINSKIINEDLVGVCGYDGIHYNSSEEAHLNGTNVINCGPCGSCSNIYDVKLYWITKDNLTEVTRMCAFKSLFSEKWGYECMKKKVGFTDECNKCWLENIKCDRKNCKWICLWSMLNNESYVDDYGRLNKCLQCDEDKCGPAFKECAGANRRRSCIKSDIFRDEDTICTQCDTLP